MILHLLEHLLGEIGLDLVILNLTLKIVQERRFFRNLFSQGNGVGLRLYTDYMISKYGCDWFLWILTCFALKMEFFWKSDKERQTLWFWWFCRSWLMKHTCILYCTHMWFKCTHSWGIWPCLVDFDLFVSIIFQVVKWEMNFVENGL